eukprot:328734-Hanusia_phi.AAC.3
MLSQRDDEACGCQCHCKRQVIPGGTEGGQQGLPGATPTSQLLPHTPPVPQQDSKLVATAKRRSTGKPASESCAPGEDSEYSRALPAQ